jgi:hypothetical protein
MTPEQTALAVAVTFLAFLIISLPVGLRWAYGAYDHD